MNNNLHLERALFVVGKQNAGKSTQLRSMFTDHRFNTERNIPSGKRLPIVTLSNDRWLYILVSSPHERNLAPYQFHKRIRKATGEGRWCFAGALQPFKANKMPDVVDSIGAFKKEFNPERIRVCFLTPDYNGRYFEDDKDAVDIFRRLKKIKDVEVVKIDSLPDCNNGLLLADFFDFT